MIRLRVEGDAARIPHQSGQCVPQISYQEESNWRWPRGCTLQLIPWQCRETHFLWPASSQRLGTAWVLRHASSWEKLWLPDNLADTSLPFLLDRVSAHVPDWWLSRTPPALFTFSHTCFSPNLLHVSSHLAARFLEI